MRVRHQIELRAGSQLRQHERHKNQRCNSDIHEESAKSLLVTRAEESTGERGDECYGGE
jgi:hypothetical protein